MIHDNLYLHNVAELEPAAGGGHHLRRFPAAVRQCLSPLGRLVALESAGCEVRFVTESTNLRIALSSLPSCFAAGDRQQQDVYLFRGAFFHSIHRIEPGRVNHIQLNDFGGAGEAALRQIRPELRDSDYFSHDVWRVIFGRYPAIFHEVEANGFPVRPPTPAEMPKRRIIFYGSSITSGGAASVYHMSFVQQTARRLHADAYNHGLSGSCRCEPEMAGYLAARDDWDMACLELGVNVRGAYTPEEFAARSRYLVEQIIARHPAKPVVLVTILPNAESPANALEANDMQRSQLAFDQCLRDLVAELNHPHLHLVEGNELMTDYTGISKDLIHPSDYGHTEIALNLASRLAGLF